MLKLLHEGHVGIEKCNNRARQIFYWSGLSVDIEATLKNVVFVKPLLKNSRKSHYYLMNYLKRPWKRFGLDIYPHANKSFLIVFYSYSNWLEMLQIKDKSAKLGIFALKSVFSMHLIK